MKYFFAAFFALFLTFGVKAQNFDDNFQDATLRLDYIFAGDASRQDIYLENMIRKDRWAGRRGRLAEVPLQGNGQVTVRDHASGQVLYVTTFSSLFQEYMQYDEAKHTKRAFQTTYYVPFPKRPVDITVSLTNNRNEVVSEMTHTVNPDDILIRREGKPVAPYHYVWKGARAKAEPKPEPQRDGRYYVPTPYDANDGVNIADCVDIAIIAEGYTQEQMGKFYQDCQRATDALFEREPFAGMKDRFNVVAVAAPSVDAGPSVPHHGIWAQTAAGTNYDTFYSDRYLMTQQMHRVHDLLTGIPAEHVIVLVNADTYGGGGIFNEVTVATSDHPTFKQVFVHEFGHAYGGLADEYAYDDMDEPWYPADVEPWEPNITTLHDFGSKWADMMPKGQPIPTPLDPKVPDFATIDHNDAKAMQRLNDCVQVVGVFEGAGYQTKGCYRPAQECRMKINDVLDFCPVCARAIRRITDFYTAPTD